MFYTVYYSIKFFRNIELISLLTFTHHLSFNTVLCFGSRLCFLLQVKETTYIW